MIGDWGKGWEIQVQPVAVQSKPKRMQEGMWERRAFISLPLDSCQEPRANALLSLRIKSLLCIRPEELLDLRLSHSDHKVNCIH